MGRPPIGKQAMSAAERMRRHRARLRGGKPIARVRGISSVVRPQYVATLYELLLAYTQLRERSAAWLAELQAELAEREQQIGELLAVHHHRGANRVNRANRANRAKRTNLLAK